MKLRIEIDMSNAAFYGDGAGEQVAEILESVARVARDNSTAFDLHKEQEIISNKVRDINGNTVGKATVTR